MESKIETCATKEITNYTICFHTSPLNVFPVSTKKVLENS